MEEILSNAWIQGGLAFASLILVSFVMRILSEFLRGEQQLDARTVEFQGQLLNFMNKIVTAFEGTKNFDASIRNLTAEISAMNLVQNKMLSRIPGWHDEIMHSISEARDIITKVERNTEKILDQIQPK